MNKKIGKIFCFFNLHLYKDSVLFDYLNATPESVSCIMREKCERCGKIRNEVKGAWLGKVGVDKPEIKEKKGKNGD